MFMLCRRESVFVSTSSNPCHKCIIYSCLKAREQVWCWFDAFSTFFAIWFALWPKQSCKRFRNEPFLQNMPPIEPICFHTEPSWIHYNLLILKTTLVLSDISVSTRNVLLMALGQLYPDILDTPDLLLVLFSGIIQRLETGVGKMSILNQHVTKSGMKSISYTDHEYDIKLM